MRCSGVGMPTMREHVHRLSMASRVLEPWCRRIASAIWLADGEDRVERGHRLLEDHRDLLAADRPHLARCESASRSDAV